MKTIQILILVLLTGSASVFAQKISKAELQVNGLTCSMCSRATETAIKSLGFVDEVTPDLNRNVFVVTFKKDAKVNIDQMNAKVQDAGFSIGEFAATINFNNTSLNENGVALVDGHAFKFVDSKQKTLDGAVTARVIDKNFITSSAFKKKVAELNIPSYATGKGVVDGKEARMFHLSI